MARARWHSSFILRLSLGAPGQLLRRPRRLRRSCTWPGSRPAAPSRREDGVGQPLTGNAIISVPMLVTANPVGSVVAHASMHVAAEAHSHETEVFLPPQTDAD